MDSSSVLKIQVINVTRLNGKSYFLNAIYIESIESFPDTTITLTSGHKYVVKETKEEVLQQVTNFYRSINLLGLQLEEHEDEK